MRTRTVLTIGALATLLVVLAAFPVAAFTEGETEGEAEVVEEDQGSELGIEPAVEAPPVAEEEEELPWTQRFLAPTVAALAVLGLIASIVYYGLRVRGKYRLAR